MAIRAHPLVPRRLTPDREAAFQLPPDLDRKYSSISATETTRSDAVLARDLVERLAPTARIG